MSYNEWLSGEDIPTIRRIDYIVDGTDSMESGYLYARLRKMTYLYKYNSHDLTDEIKAAEFKFEADVLKERLIDVNNLLISLNRERIFSDINDWKAIYADYDYFWELRTEKQFAREEAEAILGISNRRPVVLNTDSWCNKEHRIKLQKMIDEYVEKLK